MFPLKWRDSIKFDGDGDLWLRVNDTVWVCIGQTDLEEIERHGGGETEEYWSRRYGRWVP